MFPEENKCEKRPMMDEEKDEVLDFSFNQAYQDKSPSKKNSPQINISISITPSDNSSGDEIESVNKRRGHPSQK